MQTKTAKRGNRLLCLLLALVMVCSLLPMSALAADGDTGTGTETEAPATTGKVSTSDAAVLTEEGKGEA